MTSPQPTAMCPILTVAVLMRPPSAIVTGNGHAPKVADEPCRGDRCAWWNTISDRATGRPIGGVCSLAQTPAIIAQVGQAVLYQLQAPSAVEAPAPKS